MLNTLAVLTYLLSHSYHHHTTLQIDAHFQETHVTRATEKQSFSPQLRWKNIPPGAQSIALVMKDVDTTNKPHYYWVVYNLPAESSGFALGESKHINLNHVGWNSWGKRDIHAMPYHSIILSVYALDKKFSIDHMTGELLEQKIQGHVLAMGEIKK